MLDPAITAFFDERKEGWLKKNLSPDMSEAEKMEVEKECASVFSLENWLPNAAKRARQMSISTHPCTFSHPSARKNKNGYVTSVIADAERRSDGYLRTGNTSVNMDAFGNAAALDVYKFLSIICENGKTVVEHIQADTELAKLLLDINAVGYDDLKSGFMAMMSSDETQTTSSKIKQVYFPVGNSYHQLSILSNSGLIFELRKRIDNLRFSEQVKEGRELRRKNAYFESGYSEIFDVATIGYGGTKPQNISVLNNQYGGKAHLLLSVPPVLQQREMRFPTKNFFTQSLRYFDCRAFFERLDKVFKIERDGQIPLGKVRIARDRCLGDILEDILRNVMTLRVASTEQFRPEASSISSDQKIWLCEQYKRERVNSDDWLSSICEQIAGWIVSGYAKTVKQPVMLGEAERQFIKDYIEDNREVLK